MSSQGKGTDKLVYMANQIGKFFVSQGETGAVDGIAAHLKKFWDPRMREKIVAHLDAGGAGLDPPVRKAVEALEFDGRAVRAAFDADPCLGYEMTRRFVEVVAGRLQATRFRLLQTARPLPQEL